VRPILLLDAHETFTGIRNIKSRQHFEKKEGRKKKTDSNCYFDLFGLIINELAT